MKGTLWPVFIRRFFLRLGTLRPGALQMRWTRYALRWTRYALDPLVVDDLAAPPQQGPRFWVAQARPAVLDLVPAQALHQRRVLATWMWSVTRTAALQHCSARSWQARRSEIPRPRM